MNVIWRPYTWSSSIDRIISQSFLQHFNAEVFHAYVSSHRETMAHFNSIHWSDWLILHESKEAFNLNTINIKAFVFNFSSILMPNSPRFLSRQRVRTSIINTIKVNTSPKKHTVILVPRHCWVLQKRTFIKNADPARYRPATVNRIRTRLLW